MPSLKSLSSSPGTTITTTTETLAINIPPSPLTLPGASPGNIIIRGTLFIATGASTTSLAVRLRVGQNNTTTNQIGNAVIIPAGAGNFAIPFTIIDNSGAANLNNSGYSVTVVQSSAAANGTVTAVAVEVDYSYS